MEAQNQFTSNGYLENPNKSLNSFEDKNKIKEYILKINNEEYKLKISYDINNIFLKIERKNELLLYNYENKFNYNDIVSILKLPPEIYNESNKVVDVLDKAYENKKLILKFDEDNINMLLIVKLSIGFQEIDCPLQIRKKYYDINEIFNIILGELKSLKQIKKELIAPQILELEKKIESLKILITNEFGKINETIQILSKQNKENIEKLNKNKNEIKLLKDELCAFKEFKSKKKIESNINNNLDSKKKQKENNISTKLGISSIVSIQEEPVYEVKKLNKEEKEDFTFNIIIEGAEKVGKSSIIEKFVEMKNPPEKEGISNFGYKIINKYVKIDNTIIKLEIIDFVVGDISRRSTNNYKNADLIMFIYSINDSKSFEKIIQKLWSIKSKSKQIYFLVGNKSELGNRNVQQKEAKNALMKYNISYFIEASAKTGDNIDNIFYEAVKILYKNKKVSNIHKAKIIELSKGEELKKTNTALKFLFPA